jgi:hypothetical protein
MLPLESNPEYRGGAQVRLGDITLHLSKGLILALEKVPWPLLDVLMKHYDECQSWGESCFSKKRVGYKNIDGLAVKVSAQQIQDALDRERAVSRIH